MWIYLSRSLEETLYQRRRNFYWGREMAKFNKKTKGKEKKLLNQLQEEFNPSARDPYMGKKERERLEKEEALQEELKETLKKKIPQIEEEEE